MDLRREKQLRDEYLLALHRKHNGYYGADHSNKDICNELGIVYNGEAVTICQFLKGEGYIEWVSFDRVWLTHPGRIKAEQLMESTYAEREKRVLQKLSDMSEGIPGEMIVFETLVKELGMTDDEVSGISKGLEQQNYVDWRDGDVIEITAQGLHALESSPKAPSGGDTYNTHIGTIHGAAQIGSGNVQNVEIKVTNNPEFDQAIAGLLKIVDASGLPHDELEELKDEVIKLNKLALSEPKADFLEKAKFRIDKAKLSFEAAKLLVQAAPHLHTAWEYLKVHFG